MENAKIIVQMLEERRDKLLKIANSNCPNDPNLSEAHRERVSAAKSYIKELDSLIRVFSNSTSENICIVPINIFEKKLETADFATIEDEGYYFRMAHVISYPSDGYTLLYLVPLSSI